MSVKLREAQKRFEIEHGGVSEGWLLMLLATLGGAAGVVLSFAPWNFFPLAFIALIPVLAVTRHATDGQVFRRAWLFGIFTNIGGFPWIVGLTVRFGGMPPAIGVVLLLLLSLQQGLIPALGFWLGRKVERGFGWRHGMALPVAFVAAEALIPLIFPWRLGHSQVYHLAFLQLAELGGVHLMTFMVVLVNLGLYDGIRWMRERRAGAIRMPVVLCIAIVAFCLTEIYGAVRIRSVESAETTLPTLRVGLVQGNIDIKDKWNPRLFPENLFIHQKLSAKAAADGAELLVWPESAYQPLGYYYRMREDGPLLRLPALRHGVYQLPPSKAALGRNADQDRAKNLAPGEREAPQRGFDLPLITGADLFRRTTEQERNTLPPLANGQAPLRLEYNSAILLDRDGRVEGIADKVRLMPIAESIPGAQWVWTHLGINLYAIIPDSGLFGHGDGPSVLTHTETLASGAKRAVRIGILNCYEDLMPGFVRKMGRMNPQFLLNQSNDAWFGRDIEPYEHFALAIPRAVEARTWLLRATNTGVTAFVDASGRVRARTGTRESAALVHDVPLKTASPTPYRIFGEWVAALSWIVVLLGVFFRWRLWRAVKADAKTVA